MTIEFDPSSSSAPNYISEMDYDANGNLIYYGLAAPNTAVASADWFIRKLSYDASGNLLSVLDANGTVAFNSAWTNRVALPYS